MSQKNRIVASVNVTLKTFSLTFNNKIDACPRLDGNYIPRIIPAEPSISAPNKTVRLWTDKILILIAAPH